MNFICSQAFFQTILWLKNGRTSIPIVPPRRSVRFYHLFFSGLSKYFLCHYYSTILLFCQCAFLPSWAFSVLFTFLPLLFLHFYPCFFVHLSHILFSFFLYFILFHQLFFKKHIEKMSDSCMIKITKNFSFVYRIRIFLKYF